MDKDEIIKSGRRKIKLFLDSATFALLISVALFSYEMISSTEETEKIVDNLMEIQSSLSTRYLGLFPEYIDNINNLLNNAIEQQDKNEIRDSIIIFEDVLYYGMRSDAEGFRRILENLVTLSNGGCHITIAYYDPKSMPFKQMIQDKLLYNDEKRLYNSEMNSYRARLQDFQNEHKKFDPKEKSHDEIETHLRAIINTHFDNYLENNPSRPMRRVLNNIQNYSMVDSIISQRYYQISRDKNRTRIESMAESLRRPLPQRNNVVDATTLRINKLFTELDEIKQQHMSKPYMDITYWDFHNMYRDIAEAISKFLEQQPNIELLPLMEDIQMCCWMSSINGRDQAIFAFPSKYSTDEIGFISQDVAIARYIRTMLNGIRETH